MPSLITLSDVMCCAGYNRKTGATAVLQKPTARACGILLEAIIMLQDPAATLLPSASRRET